MHSLCIADQLGVLKSIEHIAKTLHAENLPPPPPYITYPKPRQSSKSQQAAELTTESVMTEGEGIIVTASKPLENTVSQSESLQCDDKSTGPEFSSSILTETAAVSKPLVEGDGLRRRRKKEEREQTTSKAVDMESSGTTSDTLEILRNVYYGVGAGTFCFNVHYTC